MPSSWAEEVLYMAKRLPREDQLRIAEELQKGEQASEPPELSDEWKAELNRRLKKLEDGSAVLIDGEEHKRRLLQKYGG